MAEKFIQQAIKKPGALHKQMGVPKGQDIPVEDLQRAASSGGKLGNRARLALLLRRVGDKKPATKPGPTAKSSSGSAAPPVGGKG